MLLVCKKVRENQEPTGAENWVSLLASWNWTQPNSEDPVSFGVSAASPIC